MKKAIQLGVFLGALGVFMGVGCELELVTTELTDPCSTTQGIVEDVNTIGQALRPAVKVVETQPWAMPVSLVFNGAMAVVAGLYRMRRQEERTALQQAAAALQVVKPELPGEVKAKLKKANNLAQTPATQGVIRRLKAETSTRAIIENVRSAIAAT